MVRAPTKPFRIAYVINSMEGGGAALPVPSLLSVAREAGAEVRVLALTRRDGRAIGPVRDAGLDLIVRDGGERDHAAALSWLDARVSEYRPSHIWTSLTRATALGQIVGVRRRVPVVSWQHAAWLRPANRRLLRATQRLSRLWLADSDAVARFCHDRLGIGADRLAVWPIFRADPAVAQAQPWRPGEMLRVGSLGRLHPVKGYDVLIAALALARARGAEFAASVAGEGGERARLEAQAASAGVRTLRLTGYVDDPHRWLTTLHLYVQPSRSEGFCVAAHEAIQAGLPVIGSNVGEMARSIEDGVTGWRVPPGDVERLAAVMLQARDRAANLAAMGAAGRARLLARYGSEAFRANGLAFVERLRALN